MKPNVFNRIAFFLHLHPGRLSGEQSPDESATIGIDNAMAPIVVALFAHLMFFVGALGCMIVGHVLSVR